MLGSILLGRVGSAHSGDGKILQTIAGPLASQEM
jgi:hypothetical protein